MREHKREEMTKNTGHVEYEYRVLIKQKIRAIDSAQLKCASGG